MYPRSKAAAAPLLAAVVMFFSPGSAWSADIAGSAGLDFLSKYIWRGIAVTDGFVAQPSASAEDSGLTAGVWANMDIDDVGGLSGKFNEVDYTVGYAIPGGEKASFSIGLIRYTFPNTGSASTTELSAGVSLDAPGAPSLTLYKDVDEFEGLCASLAGGYGIPLPGERTLDIGLALGFGDADHNAGYYGVASSGPTDALLTVGSTFEFSGGRMGVTPSLAISTALDGDIADALEQAGMDSANVVVGVSVSESF
jgi:hypothetical protein